MKCLTTLSIFINVATRGQASIVWLSFCLSEGPFCNISQLVQCGATSLVSHLFSSIKMTTTSTTPSTFCLLLLQGAAIKKRNLFKRIKNWKSHKHAFATSLGTGMGMGTVRFPSLPLGLPLNKGFSGTVWVAVKGLRPWKMAMLLLTHCKYLVFHLTGF